MKKKYLKLSMLLSLFFLGSNVLAQDAAPTPPTLATAKVISIFSDKFTNVAGTDFFPNWSQSPPVVVSIVSLSGSNQTLSYANLSYQGVQLAGSVNAANMVFLHVDVYTTDETSLQITPIGDGESLVTLTPLTLNGWNSFDVPLVSFTGVNKSNISQFKFVGSGGKTVLLDNLYFWDNTPADVTAPTAFTATRGLSTYNSVELLLNATDNTSAIDYTVSFNTTTINVGGVAGTQKSYKVENLMPSTAYSFTITAKDAAGNEATNNPLTVMATTTSLPSNAPTPAALAPAKVISIFSDAFANVAGTDFYPNWSQSPPVVVSIVTLAGTNQTLSYANLSYQGIQLAGSVNAANMVFLHVDIYSENETSLQVTPIGGGETLVTLTPLTLNGWNSFDVPLVSFTGVNKSNISQFKFVGSGGKNVLIDNLYFWDNTATVDTEAPTTFTGTTGSVAANSVELLLNAYDNTSVINYTVSYNTTTVNVAGVAGTQKTALIEGLMASTAYTFTISAKDATGNMAANTITVMATTTSVVVVPAAPTPAALAPAKVISIFSDAFTNVAGTNFYPFWDQPIPVVVTIETLAGNNLVLKYTNLSYQGIQLAGSVNAANMVFLHVDIYSENETSLQVTPIGGGETLVTLTPLTLNGWNSFDVPLVSFTGVNKSNISQFKFVGSGGKNVLIDNLYFWDNSATVDAEAPTAFVATKGSVEANSVELLLNANDNTNVINYTVSYNTTTVNVAGVAGTQKTVLIEGLMASTAYTFTITAKDATGNMAANTLTVMATTTSVVVVPAAPTPAALAAEKVISIFSDAFVSSAGGLNVNPSWSQATLVSIVTLSGGNTALEYKNFNYQGTEFSKLDVSKLKFLHLDLYSANLPSVEVSIISPGQENFYNVTLSGGKWNSVDIALTNYTVPDLTEIFQLKIENKSVFGKTLLVDNIYFWTDFVSTVVGPPAKAKPSFPITFEDSSTVNYSISDFAGNTLSGIAADPDNANNKVLKSVRSPKVSGFEAYAGTVIAGKSFVNPIRFVAGKTKITARVYSPDANTLIALKVEGDGTPTESLALTTAVGWNNLTFDFGTAKTVAGMKSQVAQLDKDYTKLVIFYNFFVPGATQAVDKTYYVDDINTDAISTSVKSGNKNNEFSIYPNPSEGAFSVESTINATYEIVNTSGVLVKSGTLVVGVNSIASDLQSGIYVLRANGTVKKLVVR